MFGFVVGTVFTIIAGQPLINGGGLRTWALPVAATLLILALVRPHTLGALNRAWFRLGLVVHRVVSTAAMVVVFGLVITPVAVLLRLIGRDAMRRALDPKAETYMTKDRAASTDMRKQF